MKIKAHHIKMARAAWRSRKVWQNCWKFETETFNACTAIINWHRAAKGKHQ